MEESAQAVPAAVEIDCELLLTVLPEAGGEDACFVSRIRAGPYHAGRCTEGVPAWTGETVSEIVRHSLSEAFAALRGQGGGTGDERERCSNSPGHRLDMAGPWGAHQDGLPAFQRRAPHSTARR